MAQILTINKNDELFPESGLSEKIVQKESTLWGTLTYSKASTW